MSSVMMAIYSRLPVWLQNAAVSMKGKSFVRKRYGKLYRQHVDRLMRSQWSTASQFRQFQDQQLAGLVSEAAAAVPYYRDTLAPFADRLSDVSLDSIAELPFLAKEDLRTGIEAFTNPARLAYGYDEGHTSGTTGAPLVWKYDTHSIQHDLAFRERQYRWAGINGMERSARFSGRVLLGKHDAPPYWRHNRAENQWLFSVYHITDDKLPLYYQAFRDIGPAYLDGYPSALWTIARWINQQGLSGSWRPWCIFTTAEALLDSQREEIEQAFGCKVFNFYSSSEGAPFVTQCESGSMHLNPESGIIEFLRPDGAPADLGEQAELVVTSFFQRTVPLIRYRIGDTGALAEEQTCSCGRHMPIVAYIGGRESDVLVTPGGARVGSAGLSTALYGLPFRIRESQIEQVDEAGFVFRYVPLKATLSEDQQALLRKELHSRLGASSTITIESTESIPKGARGKARLIIGLARSKTTRSPNDQDT